MRYGTRLDMRVNGEIKSRIYWEDEMHLRGDFFIPVLPAQLAMSAIRAAGNHADWHVITPVQIGG